MSPPSVAVPRPNAARMRFGWIVGAVALAWYERFASSANNRFAVGVLGLLSPSGLRPALARVARVQAFAIVRHVRFSRSLALL